MSDHSTSIAHPSDVFADLVDRPRRVPAIVWRALGILTPLTAIGLSVFMALSARTPSFPYDEISLLETARWFSGASDPGPVEGAGYFPAWPFLLAPLWWFLSDPQHLYTAVIIIGIIVGGVTIWPLTALARRWGLDTWPALAVAGAVMCMPARVVQADYALSERLLLVLLVLLVLAVTRFVDRGTIGAGILVAAATAAVVLSHARALPVAGVVGIWLLLRIRKSSWAVVLPTAALTGVLSALAVFVAAAVNRIVVGDFKQTDGLMENLRTARPSYILTVALGQSWYQLVSTLGLIAVGAVVCVLLSWREMRRARLAGEHVFVFGLSLAMFVLSVLAWSGEFNLFYNPWRRLDAWIYGRYFDPFAAILVLLALVVVIRGSRRLVLGWAGGLTVAVLVPTLLWVAPRAPTWGFVTPAHIPGVLPWSGLLSRSSAEDGWTVPTLSNGTSFWLWASLSVVAAFALLWLLRSRPAIVVAGFAIAFAVGSVAADPITESFQQREGGLPPMAAVVEDISETTDVTEVAFLWECRDSNAVPNPPVAKNFLSFWLQPVQIDRLPDDAPPAEGLVIACTDWPEGEAIGAEPLPGATGFGRTLWVVGGELQDELRSEGILAD